ncbi:mycofactocin-coupled SDR family oxidoreductase [Amycolatopsis ultiminotia]|uniref:Mycofactocin-coupled SDR family oxidoreductase n=1 Tax=Amycolatopsis ultiminotia TaxID=543629 RepID=A0ABP6V5A5_9PSEU
MKRYAGKTVVVSGAGRGQGRAHALGFAGEGANIVGFDICADLASSAIPLAREEDLAQTEKLVRDAGGNIVTMQADVRSREQVSDVFAEARRHFGQVDVVLANAGILGHLAPTWEIDDEVYQDVVDIDLVGAWRVVKHGVRAMLDDGVRGSVLVTGSGASTKGSANLAPYVAAKHGLVGLVRTAARELGAHGIRVNLVTPGNVRTAMVVNEPVYRVYFPEREDLPSDAEFIERAGGMNPMGEAFVEPEDVTSAMLYLASDDARHVTGVVFPVDSGQSIP